jgi:hypothetical protein
MQIPDIHVLRRGIIFICAAIIPQIFPNFGFAAKTVLVLSC